MYILQFWVYNSQLQVYIKQFWEKSELQDVNSQLGEKNCEKYDINYMYIYFYINIHFI